MSSTGSVGSESGGVRLHSPDAACDLIRAWPEAPSLSCPYRPAGACRPCPIDSNRTAMTTMTHRQARHEVDVTGGVDTHQDTHAVAAVDPVGRVLGSAQFPADAAGYAALLAWL